MNNKTVTNQSANLNLPNWFKLMRIRFDIHLKKNHHRCERKMDQQINIVCVQHELNFNENAAHN